MKNLTYRNAVIRGHDDDARTVELSFSSEEPVARWEGLEILDHSPGSIRTERLQNGAPLLMDHDTRDQIGVVESVKFGSDRKGRAVVRFSRNARADDIYRDVVDGIRGNVSVGYLIHETHKEGANSYRVTDWEPYEISIVSVPADTTVGVGRSALPKPTRKQEHHDTWSASDLRWLIEQALSHPGGVARTDGNGDITRFIPLTPASARTLSLASLAGQADPTGFNQYGVPVFIAEKSLAAQAGAAIVPVGVVRQNPTGLTDVVVMSKVHDKFVSVQPALFAQTADGAKLNVSEKPYLVATYDSETAPAYGVVYKLTRQQMKHEFADDTVFTAVTTAIIHGIANLIDSVAIDGITQGATLLTDISFKGLAKLSTAKGLRFDELRALAGGELAGVEMATDGVVRACGVRAELTEQANKTIIGAFSRMAIGIDDDIRITVRRLVNAEVEVTAWVNAQALIPDPSVFWMA